MSRASFSVRVLLLCCTLGMARTGMAAERVQLRNGFTLDCDHHEVAPDGRVRLVMDAANRMDVDAAAIVAVETVETPLKATADRVDAPVPATSTDLATLIATAGAARNINVELLRSVVQAESGGHVNAMSRTGAQGLMQLMPSTARSMGVRDSFAAEENLRGGTAYLDQLLTRYGNNIVLALAAYNAGPGAVDRYHGVPPYRETVAYVSRVIREFNRRTIALQKQAAPRNRAILLGAKLP